jgi:hypothetical protein
MYLFYAHTNKRQMAVDVEKLEKDNSEMTFPLYRIKEVQYKNHTEFWVQKSKRILGIHLFWDNTTIAYFREFESAQKELEDVVSPKNIIHYIPSTKD